ncbi:MAG: hypothetical protein MUD08_11300 [Cytophagales bacterium]|jgi:ribosomal protein S1|nr:hypothetical protein [Cytophagales bacterium]
MNPSDEEWETIKQRFKIGDEVIGKVVAKSPFGDWLDIGVGCACLLEIFCIKGLTPEIYRSGDYNPIGSVVTATIVSFENNGKQIRLTQLL